MKTSSTFDAIAENFSFLEDWEDRYRYLIDLGQVLSPLAPEERSAANKVHGCVSQVWLVSERSGAEDETRLTYRGESDAMIVRGLVAVLVAIYSDRPPREIAETDAVALFDELGLREHLTSQRSNGLVAMVDRIRGEAKALL